MTFLYLGEEMVTIPAGMKEGSIIPSFLRISNVQFNYSITFLRLGEKMTTHPSQPFLTEVGGTSFDSVNYFFNAPAEKKKLR